jgi:hypothetical protein
MGILLILLILHKIFQVFFIDIEVFSGKEDKDNFFYDAVVLQKTIRRIDCDAARLF